MNSTLVTIALFAVAPSCNAVSPSTYVEPVEAKQQVPATGTQIPAAASAATAEPARPLTPDDALFVIEDIAGRMVPVRDVNGDGLGDLVVARGPARGIVKTFDLLSSKDGSKLRTLYACTSDDPTVPSAWDAGGDVDGDGIPDLLLGFADFDHGAGRVLAISGANGNVLHETRGTEPNERLGASLVFVGDTNGDGYDDFVVGALQTDTASSLNGKRVVRERGVTVQIASGASRSVWTLDFDDGTSMERNAYYQLRLDNRSSEPGYISLRSGRDAHEAWRAAGARAGHGFGTTMQTIGDIDGDGITELAVLAHPSSLQPGLLVSGATGLEVARVTDQPAPMGRVGDVDHDGIADFYRETLDDYREYRLGSVQILSGRTRERLFELPYPGHWSEFAITAEVGDIDDDGCADIALGDGNFNLLGKNHPGGTPGFEVEVTKLRLDEAVVLESQPWLSSIWESGCAVVYSGRTHRPIFGVWARPSSQQGLGLEIAALPDVNGDGAIDLIVADDRRAFVFAGPGRGK